MPDEQFKHPDGVYRYLSYSGIYLSSIFATRINFLRKITLVQKNKTYFGGEL